MPMYASWIPRGRLKLKKGIRGGKLGLGIEMVEIAFNFNYDPDGHENKEVMTEGKNRAI